MFSFLKRMMGAPADDIAGLISQGAVIVDVRTPEEFKSGHAKGSRNIPLDRIASQAGKLKDHEHVIVCCRSGARSGQAMHILRQAGVPHVVNAGSWQNVRDAQSAG